MRAKAIGILMAACAAVAPAAAQTTAPPAAPAAGPVAEIGWVGLFNRELVDWLENGNQLDALCPKQDDAHEECRAAKMAAKLFVVPLWSGPGTASTPSGSLLLLAEPGIGIRTLYVAPTGGKPVAFRPDLFDGDWGYGPYCHQTFLDHKGDWFQLPADPFPTPLWVNLKDLGEGATIQLVDSERILEGPRGDLKVLRIEADALVVRPEQEADMWCDLPPAPPLKPWTERRIPRRALYSKTGHLVISIKYTRGC
jgi:hypothetical protein